MLDVHLYKIIIVKILYMASNADIAEKDHLWMGTS